MPVVFINRDLFRDGTPRALAHGCNCAGAMGKGIAKEFKRQWPDMFKEYRERCRAGEFHLGDVFVWEEAGWTIFNLGTQQSWSTKADITAIEKSVCRMLDVARDRSISRIDLPRIGAGLGRVDWEIVRESLERVAASSTIILRVFAISDS